MAEKQTKWWAVAVEVSAGAEEAVEFALNELDSLGNEIDHLGKKDRDNLTVVGYFNELPEREIIEQSLSAALAIHGFPADSVKRFQTNEVADRDWLEEWKKYWKPTITEKFIIAPPWEQIEQTEKFIIRIEPNMAFGTGTHETTRLCLRAIENHYKGGMSFFDVGTGTGILAIAAARLNSDHSGSEITGCDTDEDSIKIAKENAVLNETKKIDFFVGSITAATPGYDFVCANVTADVIVPLLPLLVEKTNKMLVLSGILAEQKDLVLGELDKLVTGKINIETDGEWISVVIRR